MNERYYNLLGCLIIMALIALAFFMVKWIVGTMIYISTLEYNRYTDARTESHCQGFANSMELLEYGTEGHQNLHSGYTNLGCNEIYRDYGYMYGL